MTFQHDAAGQPYIDVNTVRLTWIDHGLDDWAGSGRYLRVQAYRSCPTKSQALHRGAEFPVRSGGSLLALVTAIMQLALSAEPTLFDTDRGCRADPQA